MPIRLPASPRETQANQYAPHRREIRLGIVAISAQVGLSGYPNEFGYVDQLCEITANTKRGARGFILPPKTKLGNPAENTLPPTPRPRSRTSTSRSKRSCSTAGSCQPRATPRSRTSPTRSTSPAARKAGRGAPAAADSDTAPAPKAGSATSNAARPGPLTPQRRHRPPDLGRMGGAQLQH
jgi:hypothetical protein